MNLTDNALLTLKKRCLKLNETPEEMFHRVANAVAEIDRLYGATQKEIEETANQFYQAMTNLEFLPNSPTLMNAGNSLGQLLACFVLPIKDNMVSIFDAIKNAALIHQSGGGTGFSFSNLRPENSLVASTGGKASGPVSFMVVFNAATEAVKQGGKRRGGNQGLLRVDHPDIYKFTESKKHHSLANFSLSVGTLNSFMQAVKMGADFALINPQDKSFAGYINAQDLFNHICQNAWELGCPGLVFLDTINERRPPNTPEIEAVNVCGEIPLLPNTSCCIVSYNLKEFVLPSLSALHFKINVPKLQQTIKTMIHFADNLLDATKYPLPEIKEETLKYRNIGIGPMGLADALIALDIPYGSDGSYGFADYIGSIVKEAAIEASEELGKKRGNALGQSRRNASLLTAAPTGTVSIIAGCSSGIEPLYSIYLEKEILNGETLSELHPEFLNRLTKEVFSESKRQEIIQAAMGKASIQGIKSIPTDIKKIFVTAHDLSIKQHIYMQAAWQKHIDNAISKTVNLPNSATVEDIKAAFMLAWETGCKGITVYRDKCRTTQVLNVKGCEETETTLPKITISRPATLTGVTEKIKTGYGNLYVTVNSLEEKPFEVFAAIGKSGYSTMADTEAICRLVSLLLRNHVPIGSIVSQLQGIGGTRQAYENGTLVSSIPDAISKVLSKYIKSPIETPSKLDLEETCPECQNILQASEGCFICLHCGYSKCN